MKNHANPEVDRLMAKAHFAGMRGDVARQWALDEYAKQKAQARRRAEQRREADAVQMRLFAPPPEP